MSGINSDALDRFTLAHAGFGLLLGAVGAPGWVAITTAIGWELAERRLKEKIPEAFPHPSQDSASNAVTDVGAMVAGWYLGRKWTDHRWPSLLE